MDLIKESKGIHKCLLKRWEELELKDSHIIKDAEERGMKLTKSNMSNYRQSTGVPHGMTQKQVLWLAIRYGINVMITIGQPVVKNGDIVYEIDKYNELNCIKNLNKHKALFK